MSFCSQCGNRVSDTERFCSVCGNPLSAPQKNSAPNYSAPNAAPNYSAPNAAPGYGVPNANPGYGAPNNNPGYAAPNNNPGYGAPNNPGYGAQDPYGYQQGNAPAGNRAPVNFDIKELTNKYIDFANRYTKGSSDRLRAAESRIPMNWHKILVYALLIVGAVYSLFNGLFFLTGKVYGDMGSGVYSVAVSDVLYSRSSLLSVMDKFLGLVWLGTAALYALSFLHMVAFKTRGPLLILLTYGCVAAAEFLYLLIVLLIDWPMNLSMFEVMEAYDFSTWTLMIGSILGNAAMVVVNFLYYTKRRFLFNVR